MSKNLFVGNETMWLDLAESANDYAFFFLKYWIPFNAWYYNTYKLDNDRLHIEELKSKTNPIKDKIIALLGSSTSEGLYFKSSMGLLHETLENNNIKSAGHRICFSDLYFRKNNDYIKNSPYKGVRYFVEYTSSSKSYRVVVEMMRGGKKMLFMNNAIRDIDHLKSEIQRSALSKDQWEVLIIYFMEVAPDRKESLMSNNRQQALKIGNSYFIKDTEVIARAVIEVLYNLRCVLFHGEIVPNAQNLSAYEHAYHILRTLVKTLKSKP